MSDSCNASPFPRDNLDFQPSLEAVHSIHKSPSPGQPHAGELARWCLLQRSESQRTLRMALLYHPLPPPPTMPFPLWIQADSFYGESELQPGVGGSLRPVLLSGQAYSTCQVISGHSTATVPCSYINEQNLGPKNPLPNRQRSCWSHNVGLGSF